MRTVLWKSNQFLVGGRRPTSHNTWPAVHRPAEMFGEESELLV